MVLENVLTGGDCVMQLWGQASLRSNPGSAASQLMRGHRVTCLSEPQLPLLWMRTVTLTSLGSREE